MNVGVIDVGSNTIRLLVAAHSRQGLGVVARGKKVVGLGADIEQNGAVSPRKLREAAECLAGFAHTARASGAALLDVVVASPGRQAENADQLVHTLSRAAGAPARVLSREEEGRLAFEGALAYVNPPERSPSATSEAARRRSQSGPSRAGLRGFAPSTSALCA